MDGTGKQLNKIRKKIQIVEILKSNAKKQPRKFNLATKNL
jgi:hypothetical protein